MSWLAEASLENARQTDAEHDWCLVYKHVPKTFFATRHVAAVFLSLGELYTIWAQEKLLVRNSQHSRACRLVLEGPGDPFGIQCRMEDAYMLFRNSYNCNST